MSENDRIRHTFADNLKRYRTAGDPIEAERQTFYAFAAAS